MTQHPPEERGTPGYATETDHPGAGSHAASGNEGGDYAPGVDYAPGPGYPGASDYSAVPDYLPAPSYPPAGNVPAPRGHLLEVPAPEAHAPEAHDREAHDREAAYQSDVPRARLAMLAYLTVPIFGFVIPLALQLTAGRKSPWLRRHTTQALNVWLTVALYDLSAAILGTMLALDSPLVAVIVMVPLIATLWGIALIRLIRAATTASEGGRYTFPRWLCSQILH